MTILQRLGLSAGMIGIILLTAGCDPENPYALHFNHRFHVKDSELECATCHGEAENGHFTHPGHDICEQCHEPVDIEAPSEAACSMCHKLEQYDRIPAVPPPPPPPPPRPRPTAVPPFRTPGLPLRNLPRRPDDGR